MFGIQICGVQGQWTVNRSLVEKYKNDILSGKPIEPITVKYGDNVIDGYHRAAALEELGFKKVPVTFVEDNEALARREWKQSYGNEPFPIGDFNETSKAYPNFKPSSIPRPFGKKGEAGFVDAKLATKPAELAKRYLTTKGDLPKQMFDLMEGRGSQTQAMLKQVDFTLRDLATEAKKINGKPQLTPEQTAGLDAFMLGRGDVSVLPESLQPIAVQMRRQLDNLSEGLIQSGIFEGEKAEMVRSRKGEYLTRSYEKFDNPKFTVDLLKKRDPLAYAKAEKFVRDEIKAANPNATEAEVTGRIKELVEEGRDTPIESVMRASSIGKDLGVTKARKSIPPEIRFLMGEYTDPVINYARSAGKMIHLYQTQRMLTQLKDYGLANGFFFEKPTGNATRMIAAEGSETRSPLNGLYAEPELVKALESFDPVVRGNTVFELFSMANAAVKWGKTVGSVLCSIVTGKQIGRAHV